MKNKKFIRPNQSAPVKILTSFAMAGEKTACRKKISDEIPVIATKNLLQSKARSVYQLLANLTTHSNSDLSERFRIPTENKLLLNNIDSGTPAFN
jgi:hypothetical protein